jgi:hypothetical protein
VNLDLDQSVKFEFKDNEANFSHLSRMSSQQRNGPYIEEEKKGSIYRKRGEGSDLLSESIISTGRGRMPSIHLSAL